MSEFLKQRKRAPMRSYSIPKLIMFLGPEGTGKTTQARLLKRALLSKGFRVRMAWIRYNHLLSYILRRFIIRTGRVHITKFADGRCFENPDPILVRKLRFIWLPLEVVSDLVLALLKVQIPIRLKYVVIAERYLLDTITDSIIYNTYFFNLNRQRLTELVQFFLRFIPSKSFLIVLESDYDTLKERYRYRGDPIYNQEQVEAFSKVARMLSTLYPSIILNTKSLSVEECHHKILCCLGL